MLPSPEAQQFFFGGIDINFDGYRDLLLLTNQGVANSYADYWLFDASKQGFSYLGRYPIFKVDQEKRQLTNYERGGYAGLVYDANMYEFRGGKLTQIRSESQKPTSSPNVFLKVVRENVDGKLKIVSQEEVAPKKSPAP